MLKLKRIEIAAIVVTFMVAITINAVWRVRVMGAAERQRVEREAAEAAEAGVDAGEATPTVDASTE